MTKHRQHHRTINVQEPLPQQTDKKKIILLYTVGIVLLVPVIFLISWLAKPKTDSSPKEPISDEITVNGIKMKLLPAEQQIKEIKQKRAEITNCTYDQEFINCIDVANQNKQFKREYLQKFVY